MILSYKLCINILLEPLKIDIKRTQTKNETVQKYSNDNIQFTFFCLPCGRQVNSFFSISAQLPHTGSKLKGFSVVQFDIYSYIRGTSFWSYPNLDSSPYVSLSPPVQQKLLSFLIDFLTTFTISCHQCTKYLQSDWLRSIQYWPYCALGFNIVLFDQKTKKIYIQFPQWKKQHFIK